MSAAAVILINGSLEIGGRICVLATPRPAMPSRKISLTGSPHAFHFLTERILLSCSSEAKESALRSDAEKTDPSLAFRMTFVGHSAVPAQPPQTPKTKPVRPRP